VTLANANSASTSFTMPANAVTVTANFEPIPPTTYAVTVNSGTGGGNYAAGVTVNITADPPPSGQQFKDWTVNSGGVTLANANSASTSFTMPANAVTVTANFEPIPPTTPPSVPQNFTATADDRQVTLTWTAPATDGGSPILRYEVSANNGAT
jgi:hypothetical protein